MKILALESSSKAASVCLVEDGKIVSHYFQNSGLTHSKTLLKMAEDMMTNLEMKIADVDLIACAKGPGSFTGIRIGVSAAKGLAWGADLPLCGVSTLEAMAHQMIDFSEYIICPVMDARRYQVYNGLFTSDGEKITRVCDDRVLPIAELVEEAKRSEKIFILVGDGADLVSKAMEKDGISHEIAPKMMKDQTSVGVALAAMTKETEDDIIPDYLRLSQAEREKMEKGEKITV